MAGIDLNTVEEEEEEEAPPVAATAAGAVCIELWHACAGPVAPLPRKGSAVVYLPQGHLAAAGARGGDVAVDLPPHVVCSVADVELCVSTVPALVPPYWARLFSYDGLRMAVCRLTRRRTRCTLGWLWWRRLR